MFKVWVSRKTWPNNIALISFQHLLFQMPGAIQFWAERSSFLRFRPYLNMDRVAKLRTRYFCSGRIELFCSIEERTPNHAFIEQTTYWVKSVVEHWNPTSSGTNSVPNAKFSCIFCWF